MRWFVLILLFALGLSHSTPMVQLGLLVDNGSGELTGHWNRSIRGSSVQFVADIDTDALPAPASMPLLVLEDRCLSNAQWEAVDDWVRRGGVLLINGMKCLGPHGDARQSHARAEMAGLSMLACDPGVAGVYPRLTVADPLLSPFEAGDGLRLGAMGIGDACPVEAVAAEVLARGYRIEPGPGDMVRESDVITMTRQGKGDGLVVYMNFSLGRVTACYPDDLGSPTNCSGAGTARGLMRNLVANLLWEVAGIQLPLRWETVGDRPVGVVITGDVHADADGFQIRSARQMALSFADLDVPVAYYLVGRLAQEFPEHLAALLEMRGVSINGHSARGELYSPGRFGVSGPIADDVRRAEAMLEIPSWPQQRNWPRAIRTEGWASNQSQAGAWSALSEAGISLVFDHNADALLPRPVQSAPVKWFEAPVNRRLFMPLLESSVHTETDDFVLDADLEGRIFSLGSPEPDPCCNDAVRFSTYADYVSRWHEQFLKMGLLGGATEVWLWHPSTPVWKGGLDDLREIATRMNSDERVSFLAADEVAAWAYNRERVRVIPRMDEQGRLIELDLELDPDDILPVPPHARLPDARVSYWVLGEAQVPGWESRQWLDPYGRTVTVLSRSLSGDQP